MLNHSFSFNMEYTEKLSCDKLFSEWEHVSIFALLMEQKTQMRKQR